MAEVGACVRDLAESKDWLQAPISPFSVSHPSIVPRVWLKQSHVLGRLPLPVGVWGPGSAVLILSCYHDIQLGPIYLQEMDGESGTLGSCAHPAGDLL